jgi:Alginate lyase
VTTDYPLLLGVALGQEFSYRITTLSGAITITAEFGTAADPNGSPESVTVAVPADWRGDEVRFSAGDYEQDDASSATTGGGKVVFDTLAAS